MNIWTWHHPKRYFCISCCLLLTIVLCIHLEFFLTSSIIIIDDSNKPKYCDEQLIRAHYMYNQSPHDLFQRDPVRTPFTYEIANKNFCSSLSVSSKPHALVFVISKSSNFGSRDAIRRTWGNFAHITSIESFAHLRLKLIFLIDIDENYLLSTNLEQIHFNDLVQVRLPQYYTLSTFRDMAILHWTETYCPQALMTVKTDDDVFLNAYLLANALKIILSNMTISKSTRECKHAGDIDPLAAIYGYKIDDAQAVRFSHDLMNEGTRYIITDDEYPCSTYPSYMSGFGYIVNRNARYRLLCAFFRHRKSFHLSDVYITGIMSAYANIRRRNLRRYSIRFRETDDCQVFFSDQYNFPYACASALHFRNKHSVSSSQSEVFERFYVYWQIVHQNRHFFKNQGRFPLLDP